MSEKPNKVYGASFTFPEELLKSTRPKNEWKRGQTVRDPIFEASKQESWKDQDLLTDTIVTASLTGKDGKDVVVESLNTPIVVTPETVVLPEVLELKEAPQAHPFPAAAYLSAFANSSHKSHQPKQEENLGELSMLQEHDWQMDQSRPPPVESKSSRLSKLQDVFSDAEKIAYVTLVHLVSLIDLEHRFNPEVFLPPTLTTYTSFLAKKQKTTLNRKQEEKRKEFGKRDLEIIYEGKKHAHQAYENWRNDLLKKLVLYLELGEDEEQMILKMGVRGTGYEAEEVGGVESLAKSVAMTLDNKSAGTLLNHLFLLSIVDGSGYPTFSRSLLKKLYTLLGMSEVEVEDGGEEREDEKVEKKKFSLVRDVEWKICEQLRLLEALTEAEEAADGISLDDVPTTPGGLTRQASVGSTGEGKGTMVISSSATQLMKQREKRDKAKRLALMGLAAVGGGITLGLTAGLVAPLIGAGISATLGLVGVSGTATFLGSTAGVAVISGASAGMGVGLGGWKMHKRTRALNTFRFVPIVPLDIMGGVEKGEDAGKLMENLLEYEPKRFPAVTICISGWLTEGEEDFNNPWAQVDFDGSLTAGGEAYALWWEPEALQALGSAFTMIAGELVSFGVQQILGATILHALMMGLTLPMWMAKLGYALDNPWGNGLTKAKMAGEALADALEGQAQHNRPVTLIGFSLGARVVFYALLDLASRGLVGLVEEVVLIGTPVMATKTEWEQVASVCSGRVVNAYLPQDWVLGLLYRASSVGFTSVAGLGVVEGVVGIENVDLTGIVGGHLEYRVKMEEVLRECGVGVRRPPDRSEGGLQAGPGGNKWNWDDIMELKRIQGQLEDYWEPKDLGESSLPALVLNSGEEEMSTVGTVEMSTVGTVELSTVGTVELSTVELPGMEDEVVRDVEGKFKGMDLGFDKADNIRGEADNAGSEVKGKDVS